MTRHLATKDFLNSLKPKTIESFFISIICWILIVFGFIELLWKPLLPYFYQSSIYPILGYFIYQIYFKRRMKNDTYFNMAIIFNILFCVGAGYYLSTIAWIILGIITIKLIENYDIFLSSQLWIPRNMDK